MSVIKILVNHNKEGEITCPKCSKMKTITATPQLLTKRAIKVKCSCGHSFSVSLDYRRFFRRNVEIPGVLYQVGSTEILCNVTITSLSISGVGFTTKSLHNIYINSAFEIEFKLDDDSDATIREAIAIRRINGLHVGAEFSEQEKYNYELDFYMAPPLAVN
ncbi:MAG: hypothetical protein V3S24_07150 [Candidatus Tectomicrobia bacterium]